MSQATAARIDAEIRALPARTTAAIRAVRRRWSAALKREAAEPVLATATALARLPGRRWVAAELVRCHGGAFARSPEVIDDLIAGLDDWGGVDGVGRILVGPAWRRDLVTDDQVGDAPVRWPSAAPWPPTATTWWSRRSPGRCASSRSAIAPPSRPSCGRARSPRASGARSATSWRPASRPHAGAFEAPQQGAAP